MRLSVALWVGSVSAVAAFGVVLAITTPEKRRVPPDGIIVNCKDFAEITNGVFTGREDAYFIVHGVRAYLGGGTFGPKALNIGGVDPAIYLHQKCGK